MATTQEALDALKEKVEANGEVSQSAVTLIQGLAQQIRDAADDPAELEALANQLDAQSKSLGEAVAANTPCA